MAYQPPVLAGLVGQAAMAPGGFTTPSVPTSDLSEHYSGQTGGSNSMRAADSDTRQTLLFSAGIVLAALAILWLLNTTVFRSIRA